MKVCEKILSLCLVLLLAFSGVSVASATTTDDTAESFIGRDELSSAESAHLVDSSGCLFNDDRMYFDATNEEPYFVYKTELGYTMRLMVMDYDVWAEENNYTFLGSDDCVSWTTITAQKNRITDETYVTSLISNNDGAWSVSGYVLTDLNYKFIKVMAPVGKDWASQVFCAQFDNNKLIPASGAADIGDIMYACDGVEACDWFTKTLKGPYNITITEHGEQVLPYITYRIPYGGYVNFNALIPNTIENKEFTAFKSDDGLNWFVITLNSSKATSLVNINWQNVEYSTGKVDGNYIKICFGDYVSGTDYLLQNIGGSKENTLIDNDEYYTSTNDFSQMTDYRSSNIIVSNISWDTGIYDSVCPDVNLTYYENGVQSNGYVSYKVLPGSDVKATVYEYTDDASAVYNWDIQESDDGYSWTSLSVTCTVKGTLVNSSSVTRPFNITELSAAASKQYVRIVFPYGNWYNALHAFSAFPDDSYTINGTYDFAERDASGKVLLSDGTSVPDDISQIDDNVTVKYDTSKIVFADGIIPSEMQGWQIKTDATDGKYAPMKRESKVESSIVFQIDSSESFRAEIYGLSGSYALESSVKLSVSADFVNWTPVEEATYFETDTKSFNEYYSLWYVDAPVLPVNSKFIKITLSDGDADLPSWAPQIVSVYGGTIESVWGDINGDGETNIIDLIRYKKYLTKMVGKYKVNPTQIDLNDDNLSNAADLVKLKKSLLLSAIN